MKKVYLKPVISIEDFDLEEYLLGASQITGEDGDLEGDYSDSKGREDFEGEGDSGWGALW